MIGVIIAVFAACLLAWETFYRKNWMKGVSVDMKFSEPAVYAGKELMLTETIENRKKLPLHILEIAFRVQKGVVFPDAENISESDYVYKRDVFSMLGMERIVRKYNIFAAKRGHYEVSQSGAITYSVPGHRKYEQELSVSDDFYVYAARTDVRGIVQPVMALLGDRESAKTLYEDPFAFSGIRDYTPQDPMKNVNWKATARTGSLMVNTYTSVRSETVRIFLDVEDRNIRKQGPLTEDAISCAATLCENLLRMGQEVSLFVNVPADEKLRVPSGSGNAAEHRTGSYRDAEPVSFTEGRGRNQQKAIEQFLTADFLKLRTTDFVGLLNRNIDQNISRNKGKSYAGGGSVPVTVIISKNESRELYDAARALSENGAGCVLVVPKEKHEAAMYGSSGQLRVIRRELR